VSLDGKLLTERLDGKPISLDPGEHDLEVEDENGKQIKQHLLVRVGEQNRIVKLKFVEKADAPEPPVVHQTSVSPWAWVMYGVGGLGLGSFALFAITGRQDVQTLRETCAPHCEQGAIDRARTKLIVGDVSLVVGLAAVGVGTWLVFHPTKESNVSFQVAPHAVGGRWQVQF
jgi:hypothetical protein